MQQSVNHQADQPGSQPGPDRVKQQAGKQNEPQRQCKQTAVRPHHNHTAPCHLQSCIWLSAWEGEEEREGGRKSRKSKESGIGKKDCKTGGEGRWRWRGQGLKEEKWKRKDKSKGTKVKEARTAVGERG